MLTSALNAKVDSPEGVQVALEAIRKHLGMEVAYISEFRGDETVFRMVDAPGLEHMIKPGDRMPLDSVYCRHILAGRLPELMADTSDYDLAQSIPITKSVPIGAHMSVPIRGKDGTPLGMFCCLSPHANGTLNPRDLQIMRVFADLAAAELTRQDETETTAARKREEIAGVISARAFSMAYQPIWSFSQRQPSGFEALCRFRPEPYRSPDKWFGEAFGVGLGVDLEIAVLRSGLEILPMLPEPIYVSVNASPETVLSGRLAEALSGVPARRVVIEVTEHAPVGDYGQLLAALAPLRAAGFRLAIDDAGAGYSGLQHIVQLQPDIIKLDMSLTRSVDVDQARRALAAALIYFAAETGCTIVAEGIETESEMETLRLLGVCSGQGYFIGRPTDEAGVRALLAPAVLRKTA
ncbi:sensor domain-containing phosphodiesterase [Alsobacter sp. R-9]